MTDHAPEGTMIRHVVTLNVGSSSIKFALFEHGAEPVECLRGEVDGLGTGAPHLEAVRHGKTIADEQSARTAIAEDTAAATD